MDMKQAVKLARRELIGIFEGEKIAAPTLEEVWQSDSDQSWSVTFSVRRFVRPVLGMTALSDPESYLGRPSYKTVRIDDTGKVLSIKDRELA
jgi:hypothetical protein